MKTPERNSIPVALPRALRPAILSVALMVALAMDEAAAARLNYQIELTGLHSDNINLSEDNEVSESVIIPRLKFDFSEEGSVVEIKARGELERRHYSKDQFENETRGQFAGQLNWSVLPQRMNIVVEDYLSEESINFRDGRYPGNLQQVNIFLAGPSFYARFSDATRLQLDLRAADTHAEVAEGFDSRRYSAAAVLEHDLTPTSNVSLHATGTRVDFDDDLESVDYTRQDAFVRYDGNLRDVDYQLDLGRSRLNRSSTNDASTSLARAILQWRITPASRLRLRARRQFADEVQDMIVRLSDPDESLIPELVDASSSLVTGGVYRQREMEVEYRFNGERFGLRARPRYRTFDYLDTTSNDRTERSFTYQLSYRLTPLTSVVLNGMERNRDFDNGQEDRDHVYSLGVEQQRTRHWGWRAVVLRNERESNQPDPEYKESVVYLTLWWKR